MLANGKKDWWSLRVIVATLLYTTLYFYLPRSFCTFIIFWVYNYSIPLYHYFHLLCLSIMLNWLILLSALPSKGHYLQTLFNFFLKWKSKSRFGSVSLKKQNQLNDILYQLIGPVRLIIHPKLNRSRLETPLLFGSSHFLYTIHVSFFFKKKKRKKPFGFPFIHTPFFFIGASMPLLVFDYYQMQ